MPVAAFLFAWWFSFSHLFLLILFTLFYSSWYSVYFTSHYALSRTFHGNFSYFFFHLNNLMERANNENTHLRPKSLAPCNNLDKLIFKEMNAIRCGRMKEQLTKNQTHRVPVVYGGNEPVNVCDIVSTKFGVKCMWWRANSLIDVIKMEIGKMWKFVTLCPHPAQEPK